ncbi:MAG TPA: hypothetical protein PK867_26335 [Pirellulales bacterium]|nr:hypothetical protein [Pirellulales bacterium]
MKAQSLTYRQIASKLAISATRAWELAQAALAEDRAMLAEQATDVRCIEASKLDQWESALAERLKSGEIEAITAALRIQERRAKLLGLDSPVKVENGAAGEFQSRESLYADVQAKLNELMGVDKPKPPAALLAAPEQQPAAAPANNAPGPVPAADNSDAAERVAATLDALRSRQGRLPDVAPPAEPLIIDVPVLEPPIIGQPSFAGIPLDQANHHLPVSLPPFHPRSNFHGR